MEINFCDCGSIMVPAGSKIRCRSCGKIVDKKISAKIVTQKEKQDVIVFENNEPDLPKTGKQCEQCGNSEAYFWLVQTRAGDEPPTQFFRCTQCRRVWREYK